jgi:hypothetical protein
MYYDLSNQTAASNQTDNNDLSLGPFLISPQQVNSHL